MWALYNSYHRRYLQNCADDRRSGSHSQPATYTIADGESFMVEGRQFYLDHQRNDRPTRVDDSSNVSNPDTPEHPVWLSNQYCRGSVDALEVLRRYNEVTGKFQAHHPAVCLGKPNNHCQKNLKYLCSERKMPSKLKHRNLKNATNSLKKRFISSVEAGSNKQAANGICGDTLPTLSVKSIGSTPVDLACSEESQSERSGSWSNADDEESISESCENAEDLARSGCTPPNPAAGSAHESSDVGRIKSISSLEQQVRDERLRIANSFSEATEIYNLQIDSEDCAFRTRTMKVPEASIPAYSAPTSPLSAHVDHEGEITEYMPSPAPLPSFRYATVLRHPELNFENEFDSPSKSISADLEYLRKRERLLLTKRWQNEWEAVRGPKSYWWELKTKQFCVEFSKSKLIEDEAFKANRDNCRDWLLAFREQLTLEEECTI